MKYVWVLVSPLVLALLAGLGVGPAFRADDADHDARALRPAAASTVRTASTTLTSRGFYWQLTAPQPMLPGTALLARGTTHDGSRGTRSDDEFFTISRTGSNDVPEAALRAYHRAEKVMASADPDCDISWTLLAAIGRVETNHGRFGGARLGADGVSRPEIRGPQLDGAGDFAAIEDSDNGALDHDLVWDRAVGQMQFLPQTWASVARDGDGDGQKSPDDIDDAALGSAVYLCGAGGSLADAAGMSRAAFRYNHSDYYVQLVLSFQAGYDTGVFAVPSPPPPPAKKAPVRKATRARPEAPKPRPTKPAAAAPKSVASSTPPRPSPAPKPKPSPKPTPKPSPSPSPAAPKLTQLRGMWTACGPGFCLDSRLLDLGPRQLWSNEADADFDEDGATESNGQEFDGLAGRQVSLQVARQAGPWVVHVIGDHGYRNADGSFAVRAEAASDTPTP